MGSSSSKQQQPQPTDQQPSIPQTQQKKPQVITKTKQLTKSPQQQIVLEKEINNIVNSVTHPVETKPASLVEDYLTTLEKLVTPTVSEIQSQHRIISQTYLQPISQSYNEIPQTLTALKFTYLNCYSYNDRLTVLGLASTIVGIASFRTPKAYQLPLKTLSALKDAALSYFVGGLVVAPEIFNPLINS